MKCKMDFCCINTFAEQNLKKTKSEETSGVSIMNNENEGERQNKMKNVNVCETFTAICCAERELSKLYAEAFILF